jgi:hypothetical protein
MTTSAGQLTERARLEFGILLIKFYSIGVDDDNDDDDDDDDNDDDDYDDDRPLRNIFAPMRDEVRGKWKRLHKEELDDLY